MNHYDCLKKYVLKFVCNEQFNPFYKRIYPCNPYTYQDIEHSGPFVLLPSQFPPSVDNHSSDFYLIYISLALQLYIIGIIQNVLFSVWFLPQNVFETLYHFLSFFYTK